MMWVSLTARLSLSAILIALPLSAHPQEIPQGSWDATSKVLTLRWAPAKGLRVRRTSTRDQRETFGKGPEAQKTTTKAVDERIIEYSKLSPAGPDRVSILTLREESESHRADGVLEDQYRYPMHGRRVTLVRKDAEYLLEGERDLDEGYRGFLQGEAAWPGPFFPPGPVKPGAGWTLSGEKLRKALGLSQMTKGEATMTVKEIVERKGRTCAVLTGAMEYEDRDEFGTSQTTHTVEFIVGVEDGVPLSETWYGSDRTVSEDPKDTYLTNWTTQVVVEVLPIKNPPVFSAAELLARIEGKIRNAPTLRTELETSVEAGTPQKATLELYVKKPDKILIYFRDGGEKKRVVASDGEKLRGSNDRKEGRKISPAGIGRLITFSVGRVGLLSGWMIGVPSQQDPDDPVPPTLENEFRVDGIRFGKDGAASGVLTYTLTARASRSATYEITVEFDPATLALRKRTLRGTGKRTAGFEATEVFKSFEFGPELSDELFRVGEE